MPGLADASKAQVDPRKITHYLLDDESPRGRHKARLFRSMGFNAANWELLRAALLEHAANRDLVGEVPNAYGCRYLVRCDLTVPSGPSRCFITVWQREPDALSPRFITAYPA